MLSHFLPLLINLLPISNFTERRGACKGVMYRMLDWIKDELAYFAGFYLIVGP